MKYTDFLVFSSLWIPVISAGDIRCYCNDASCVSTGYMCKSETGRCFSKLSYAATDTKSQHGCVESLPDTDRRLCENKGGDIIKNRKGPDLKWPLLMCCGDDMCNYQKNIDISIVNTQLNDSILKDRSHSHDDSYSESNSPSFHGGREMPISERDLWFKAAVIAVPIAGGFILIMLVFLAIRMLRTDSRRQRQLATLRHQRSLTKAQLYVSDHFHQNCVCPVHDLNKLDKKGYEKIRPWSDDRHVIVTCNERDEKHERQSVVTWNEREPLPASEV